jgi:hypothetical protein
VNSRDGFAAIEDSADTQLLPPVEHPASVFGAVQRHWADQAGKQQYDIEVAGSGGLLVLRMGPIESRALAELGARAEASKDPVRGFNANADLLIQGCTAVLSRERPGEEPVATENPDGVPYRIDHHLAEALGIPDATARVVLLKVYSGVPSPDLAIGVAADAYIAWASGATQEVGENMVGESVAGG